MRLPCDTLLEELFEHLLMLHQLLWLHISQMFQMDLCDTMMDHIHQFQQSTMQLQMVYSFHVNHINKLELTIPESSSSSPSPKRNAKSQTACVQLFTVMGSLYVKR
jgi:hypothetical protein